MAHPAAFTVGHHADAGRSRSDTIASFGDRRLFSLGCGVLILHLLVDAMLGLNPGTSVTDHWPAALIPTALVLAAVFAYPRLRPGLAAASALSLGVLAAVGGGTALVLASVEGIEPATVTGIALIPAAAALFVTGGRTLWWSRRADGRKYLRRTGMALLGLAFAFEVVLPIGFAWVATHRPADPPPEADLGRPYETVTISTTDGLELAAWYVPSENGAAVITYPSREGAAPEARMLAENGFGVLAVDMRGYGESDGDPNAFGWGASADIDAGVSYLETRPDVTAGVGGLGLSVGGEQMLEAASENPDLRAVVSEGAGERSVRETLLFGPAAVLTIPQQTVLTGAVAVFSGDSPPVALDDAVAKISPRATFLIYGEKGQPGEELNRDYFEVAGEPRRIWEVPGAGHTGGLDAQGGEYERRVVGFFGSTLDIARRGAGG